MIQWLMMLPKGCFAMLMVHCEKGTYANCWIFLKYQFQLFLSLTRRNVLWDYTCSSMNAKGNKVPVEKFFSVSTFKGM